MHKGIFCIEGDWWGMRDTTTVEPIFQLLQKIHNYKFKYILRDVATRSEFEYYLTKWSQVSNSDYPILYLAFHGHPGIVKFGDYRKKSAYVTLEWIEDVLSGKDLTERIIHFGSCSTLQLNGNRLNTFVKNTGVGAISGYKIDVGWSASAGFETILFDMMQYHTFTLSGINAMEKRVMQQAGGLARNLQFRMIKRKPKK